MNSKKGDIHDFIKIVVAVVCIVGLLYLMYLIYGNVSERAGAEKAEASIEKIFLKVNAIENGGIAEEEVLIESPNDWWVIAWPYKGETEKPIQCNKDFCVCICPVPTNAESFFSIFSIREKSLEICQEQGFCKDVSKKISTGDNPIKIEGPFLLNIKSENNEILLQKK